MNEAVESRIARIESDVQHIKTDTADVRVEARRIHDRIEDLRESMTRRIDDLKDKLHSLTIWASLLYFTLAGGLLTVIAHAFKGI